ncbi:MAG TPA: hypothetical protein PKD24_15935 [Pyrinomonadaceae bacterium]|nr:hypothetical protein [Pyrinomonadaceae bacterium]HMP66821.1 hypothetical protein [Pyrinomonadaceae bacterium]
MTRFRKDLLILIIVLALGLPVSAYLSDRSNRVRTKLPASYEDEDLSLQGRKLKGWVLGAEGLLADWYWMWSLQYIGNKLVKSDAEFIDLEDLTPLNPRLLYPMLDNATDLDPKFLAAYSYGAIVLPAIDVDKAIAITRKGIRDNPGSWRLRQYLGFIYWRQKDYENAAIAYEEGASIEGAPDFMRQMAAIMRTAGGNRETARAIYRQMLDHAEDEGARTNAERRLMQLDALDEVDLINSVLAEIVEQRGRCPGRLEDIIPAIRKVLPGTSRELRIDGDGNLVDPSGVPYLLDRGKCFARIDPASRIPRSL